MHMLNRTRPFILAAVSLAAALLALGVFTLPSPQGKEHDGFSAVRVAEDIAVISKDYRSVAHPQERAKVCEYLAGRLEEMGGDVTLFRYDSLKNQNGSANYVFDVVNIMAEFPPVNPSADTTWLMMIAHYDSRFENYLPDGPVWSYGAADDGYGVGTILETVSCLLKQQQEWKQGIKVLFTDAEEAGLVGMKALWKNDPQALDNVGLIMNVDSRGTYGPALLFEVSSPDERLIHLYKAAKAPYAYSLTNVVYRYMPNGTDFTVVKDVIPGMNFSNVADINSYHTDLDNFDNISLKTIQHYGAQILPVAEKYVTDPVYSDKDYLKSGKQTVNFTIPVLGLVCFSSAIYKVVNVALFVIFLMLLAIEGLRGRIKASRVFRNSCITLVSAIGIMALGELVAYVCAKIEGVVFKPFGILQGIGCDNWVSLVTVILVLAVTVLIYLHFRASAVRQTSGSMRASAAYNAALKYAYSKLYGTLTLFFLFSAALVFTLGENMMFIIPLAFATVALVLWHLTSLKLWLVASMAVIILHAVSFLYVLFMSLTIGSLGVVCMIAFLDFMLLMSMADLYVSYQNKASKN